MMDPLCLCVGGPVNSDLFGRHWCFGEMFRLLITSLATTPLNCRDVAFNLFVRLPTSEGMEIHCFPREIWLCLQRPVARTPTGCF